MSFKIGTKIQWQWQGRSIDGVVKEIYPHSISLLIKNKKIKRNGTQDNPAYLVESKAGNLALKLQTELHLPDKKNQKSKKNKPTLFQEA